MSESDRRRRDEVLLRVALQRRRRPRPLPAGRLRHELEADSPPQALTGGLEAGTDS